MPPESIKSLKILARKLRKNGTKGEALLWRDVLKARKYWPYQFNRQFIIDNYIVDFICRSLKLIIEVDGSSHFAKDEEDFKRQQYLENKGFILLRFPESHVIYRLDEVIDEIDYAVRCLEKYILDRCHPKSCKATSGLVPLWASGFSTNK